jgi:uncharacterized membrane protein YdbT with pleckstrin-like domain
MTDDYIRDLIGENERILLVTRQHRFVLFSTIFAELVLILLIVVGVTLLTAAYPMAFYGYLLVLLPLVTMIRDILIWFNRQYIVTNRRVIQVAGVLRKDVVDSSLEKVNDVKMSQSFFGRLFDYGDIEILTASELGMNLFKSIGDPIGFKAAMLNAKSELGFSEVGVQPEEDIPTLIAKLDGLRRQGIITEAEFQKKKAELLAKM